MGINTGIEWTDSTWNPIRFRVKENAAEIARAKGYDSLVQIAAKMAGRVGQHCEHVSPGCLNCYADANNHRCLPANGTGLPYDRRSRDLVDPFIDEKVLLQPLKWGEAWDDLRDCTGALLDQIKRPRRIFAINQSDIFAEWITDEILDRIFAVMALRPQHHFQVLTKRPERMLKYLDALGQCDWQARLGNTLARSLATAPGGRPRWPLPNVWLGVTDEGDQHKRIDILRETPAAVRFISGEPLIVDPGVVNLDGIHWVICGGESGPHARPMHPEWARSLRDQCAAAGVPFFFKQWGEWAPEKPFANGTEWGDGFAIVNRFQDDIRGYESLADEDTWLMRKAGKHAAGALLDGVEHKNFPAVRA